MDEKSTENRDGNDLNGEDHRCFNIFLENNFEYKNNIEDYYSHVAPNYDSFMTRTLYNGPKIVAQAVDKLIKCKSACLLDICGGTGISGQEVYNYGFNNIDYIDGSFGMLLEAKKKAVYANFYNEMLLPGVKTTLKDEKYDCVYSVGSYVPGHLKPEVAHEYVRVMKKGAYCVIGMREEWLYRAEEYRNKLEPYMDSLAGWSFISRTVVENWYNEYTGVIYVYRKN